MAGQVAVAGKHWGNFTALTAMPNAAANPLGAQTATALPFTLLQVGDLCYFTVQNATYMCAAVGTSGGGDATWRFAFDGNATAGGGFPNVIYVSTGGDDATGQRGNSDLPFLTMAAALAVAQSGDEVLVGPGTFSAAGSTSIPAIAALTITGQGDTTTTFSVSANVDVFSLNAANRSILFQNCTITGAPGGATAQCIAGSGAASAGLFLNTNGLELTNVVLIAGGAAINTVTLTDAGICRMRSVRATGALNFTTCSTVDLFDVALSGALVTTWDQTDANRPAAGQGETVLRGSTSVGGTTSLGGQARINAQDGTVIGALTGASLSVSGATVPRIIVQGSVGAVDFQSAVGTRLPDTATALTINFAGATLTGATFITQVTNGGVNRQTVNLTGATARAAITITADAATDIVARGAAFQAPTYASANTGGGGTGTIIPPPLAMSALNIAAGGALAFNYTGNFTAGAAGVAVVSQSNTGGAALAVTTSTTQVTITSTAQAGNTATAHVIWP